jgi:molybdopterin-guanine dinucleotide biosynthesis protein MobB
MMAIPVVCIVGDSGSGKTTLLVNLIPELKRRGYRIATVKHHAHAGFDIDQPGKDSYRHAQAGSDHVVIASAEKIASYRRVEREPALDEILGGIQDVDLVLVEGYRGAGKPSIEIIRGDLGIHPILDYKELFAIASNVSFDAPVPVFNLNDVQGMVDCIEGRFLNGLRTLIVPGG